MKEDLGDLFKKLQGMGMLDAKATIKRGRNSGSKAAVNAEEALKKAGYDLDHTNAGELMYRDDKARMIVWKEYEKLFPEEAGKTAASPCALCNKPVGKAPVGVDGQVWCKKSHIPGYLVTRERSNSSDGPIGVIGIGPNGEMGESSLDQVLEQLKNGTVKNIQIPALPEGLADHKCDNPDCPIKKLQLIKAMADKQTLESLPSEKDNDPSKWN